MGLGFGFRSDFGKASFSIFDLGFHYHPKGDEDPCMFRFGIMIGLFGFHFDFGVFDESLLEAALKEYGPQ